MRGNFCVFFEGRRVVKETKPHLSSFVPWLTLVAAVFFVQGPALAQVTGYVVINPIDVCNSSGTCPVFGLSCGLHGTSTYSCTQYNSPSAANQTTQSQVSTPIGFYDADNNRNLTRATWIRSRLDVAFFPIQQWNSDNNNANPWSGLNDAVNTTKAFSYTTTNYQTIHTVNVLCNDGTKVLTSPDLQALTQRKVCDDHMGVPASNTVVNSANPPLAPTGGGKPVPLARTLGSTMSNAVDMFFLTTISVNPGGTGAVNGLSWINHNGIAIAKSGIAVGTPFGVIPHELGHGLALTHSDYGASGDGTKNLMTVGGPRIEPSTSGCFAPGTAYGGQLNSNGGMLYDLAYPAAVPTTCIPALNPYADNLTLATNGTACTSIDPTMCTTQQGAVLLSGFINLTLAATATAGGVDSATTAATANNQSASGSSKSSGIPFQVDTFNAGGESGATLQSVIFALAPGLDFQGNTPATETGTSGPHIIKQVRLSGNNGLGNFNCFKQGGLAPPARHCVQLFFTVGAFTAGNFVDFNLAIIQNDKPLTDITQLAGTQFTSLSDNGNGVSVYATTSALQTVGGVVQADSRFPDLSVPNQIDPTTFVGATQTPCSPYTNMPSQCTAAELSQDPTGNVAQD
jgi:hypothetical protein